MQTETIDDRIQRLRQFNRFFTRRIGVLREGLLHSPYTLTESRILFELATQPGQTASALGHELGLDQGYLSRTLGKLEQQGLLERTRAESDGRQRLLRLTEAGQGAFAVLNQRSHDEVAEVLGELSEADQLRLLDAMQTITRILDAGGGFKFAEPFFLRTHEPGDMGWVIHRHGVLYMQEYGWDASFEAFVAQIVANLINNFNPDYERCWITEMGGDPVGSVCVVRESAEVAKLRLLLVEPRARGLGLGARLVDECIRFARRKGYRQLKLWTQSNLVAARRIYRNAGFELVAEEPQHSFGVDLVSETWVLDLASTR